MKTKVIFLNVLKVAFSNICSILAGIIVGFIIPMIIDKGNYGYYKMFTLYYGFVGLFHFGFIDGILLKYGGKRFEDLDKERFRLYFRFISFVEIVITLIVLLLSLIGLGTDYFFIFAAVAISIFGTNITTFYQYISQATGRFNEISSRTIVRSVLTIIPIIALFALAKWGNVGDSLNHYVIFVLISIAIIYVIFFWYVYTYRSISFGKALSFKENKKEIFELFKIGFPLLIGNLICTYILEMDRLFVSNLFVTEIYADYAFAYQMINLFTTALGAVSTVLYPSLKQEETLESAKVNYDKLCAGMMILASFCLCAYYIFFWLIEWILPQYIASFKYFQVVFPILVLQAPITLIMSNYYKTFNMVKTYSIVNGIILVFSAIANSIGYFIYKDPISISIASVVVIIVWYCLNDFILSRHFKSKFIRRLIYIILVLSFFYLMILIQSNLISFFVYLGLVSVLTIFMYFPECKVLCLKIKSKIIRK